MKKKLASKLWFFARCNERVAAERFYLYINSRIQAALQAGASLATTPRL